MSPIRLAGRLASAATLTVALATGLAVGTAGPAYAASAPPVGSTVCHAGPVSGWQCGVVTAVNQTIVYPGGVVHGLFRYSACAQPGDGGAPVYQSEEQVGTVVGGSGCQTFAQPVAG